MSDRWAAEVQGGADVDMIYDPLSGPASEDAQAGTPGTTREEATGGHPPDHTDATGESHPRAGVAHPDGVQDSMSAYASADVLGQQAPTPTPDPHRGVPHADAVQDPMNAYVSADVLGQPSPRAEPDPHAGVPHADEVQDPMAGYASIDVLDERPSEEP